MTALQVLTRGIALATAVVLQPTVVAFLGLPFGRPELVVVVLAVIALVDGPGPGMVCGFVCGLVGDLSSDHLVGRQTLVLTLVGYLVGLRAEDEERSALLGLAVVAAAVLGAVGLDAGLAFVLGDSRLTSRVLLTSTAAAVAYSLLVTPFVLPPLRALLLRADPERRG